jgi:hypothetical protein
MTTRTAGTRRVLPGSPFNKNLPPAAPVQRYSLSDRVSHDRYGLGRVISVEEDNTSVVIDFGAVVRRVTLPTAKLTKL